MVSEEKDHHVAEPNCSMKHILRSFFFPLLVNEGEIVTLLLTVLRIYQYRVLCYFLKNHVDLSETRPFHLS